MKNDFSIRIMTENDISFFNEVRNSCCEYLHDKNKYSLEESKQWFKHKDPKYFIVSYKGQDIGYFRTDLKKEKFFIGLDIAKKFRGKKLAVKAYETFFENFTNKNFYLYVDKNNTRAYSLYIKLGFKKIKEVQINGLASFEMVLKR
tara:strand:+ start:6520 stop:6957 length:438 start_codon:yes stop_codon:yes gene_type:complete